MIGGLSRGFYHRVYQEYQKPDTWKWQDREDYGNRGQGTVAINGENRTMWIFELRIAEKVFEDFIAKHEIEIYRDAWLDRSGTVVVENGRIQSFQTLDGQTYAGEMFIDATYEGDLMAEAGVSFLVGREANDVYNEEFNGVQKGVFHHGYHFEANISPYKVPGDPSSGLVAQISAEDPGKNGEGDDRIHAYCFRMCLSNHPENQVPFERPAHYDATQYELLARVYANGWDRTFQKFDAIPNRKTDINNHGPWGRLQSDEQILTSADLE